MNTEKFAILHETKEHGKIRITRMSESENHCIAIAFSLKGTTLEVKMSVETEKGLEDIFDSFKDEDTAVQTVSNVKEKFNI